jgi:arylsulfatase A-like enzyme
LPADLSLYDELPAKYSKKKVSLTSNETGEQVERPLREVLRERYAEITAMDRAIGQLRKHLAVTGLRDDTVLFYCGDNGTSADASLASPYRGVKSQVYEAGIRVPGLIEWPARIPQPRTTSVRANTSDLLPTICSLVGQPLPLRPLDGIDLTPLLDGKMTVRPSPLFFWQFDRSDEAGLIPYIDPELQKGTTPIVKRVGGKGTRDFRNFRHPTISESNYLGPRAIIDGNFKLVIHERKGSEPRYELLDLKVDPAEKTNLDNHQTEISQKLQQRLRQWQESVLLSLTGKDYQQ